MLAGNLANGIPTSGGHLTQALGPINVLQNGKSRKSSPVSDLPGHLKQQKRIGSVDKLLRNSLF